MGRCWTSVLRAVLVMLALAGHPAAAFAADPLTLFLLRMLRDQAISTAIESAARPSPSSPAAPAQPSFGPPLGASESQRLKAMIDESFLHLTPAQRESLNDSLQKMLSDSRNTSMRSEIVSEFTRQAAAIRDAHRQLSRLTESDMRRIAADARTEFARLPPEQRAQLMQALQHGVPGMPRALHDMILAEFASIPAAR